MAEKYENQADSAFLCEQRERPLRELLNSFKGHAPFLIRIRTEYGGEDRHHEFGEDQIYLVLNIQTHNRILVRDESTPSRYYSIAEDYPHPVLDDSRLGTRISGIRNFKMMIEKTDSEEFHFEEKRPLNLVGSACIRDILSIGRLHVQFKFHELHAITRQVRKGVLSERDVLMPGYLPLDVSLVTGMSDWSLEAFQGMVQTLQLISLTTERSLEVPSLEVIHEDIAVYDKEPPKLDADYEMPSSWLTATHNHRKDYTDLEFRNNDSMDNSNDYVNICSWYQPAASELRKDVPKTVKERPKVAPKPTLSSLGRSLSEPGTNAHFAVSHSAQSNLESKKICSRSNSIPSNNPMEVTSNIILPSMKQHKPIRHDVKHKVQDCVHVSQVPISVKCFTVAEVSHCLKLLKLDQHIDDFKNENVDGMLLSMLDEAILNDTFHLGKFQIIKLMQFIGGWRVNVD